MGTLIAMHGLPRSGKSTIARQLSKQLGAPIVSRDALRLALHGTRYLGKMETYVKPMSYTMIEALFLAGHDIVIADETNYSRAARESLKGNWKIKFYPVMTPPDVCKERAIATNQSDLIPVIDEMANRLEPLERDEEIYEG